MNRIALCGFSYGGYLGAYALTHSKAWKLGILGAPVVDWRLYDSIYTERLLGLPADNPEGYAAAAPLEAAAQLSGQVLLIHGTLDPQRPPRAQRPLPGRPAEGRVRRPADPPARIGSSSERSLAPVGDVPGHLGFSAPKPVACWTARLLDLIESSPGAVA